MKGERGGGISHSLVNLPPVLLKHLSQYSKVARYGGEGGRFIDDNGRAEIYNGCKYKGGDRG